MYVFSTQSIIKTLRLSQSSKQSLSKESQHLIAVLAFYVPSLAKVIRRRNLGLMSHPKDWRSPGSNESQHVNYM